MKSHKRDINDVIRKALIKAVEQEDTPFNLYGRGHEPRISLSGSLAAILRGTELPRVHISGYGPNYYYPYRVFQRAENILREELPNVSFSLDESRCYIKKSSSEETKKQTQAEPSVEAFPEPFKQAPSNHKVYRTGYVVGGNYSRPSSSDTTAQNSKPESQKPDENSRE